MEEACFCDKTHIQENRTCAVCLLERDPNSKSGILQDDASWKQRLQKDQEEECKAIEELK